MWIIIIHFVHSNAPFVELLFFALKRLTILVQGEIIRGKMRIQFCEKFQAAFAAAFGRQQAKPVFHVEFGNGACGKFLKQRSCWSWGNLIVKVPIMTSCFPDILRQ